MMTLIRPGTWLFLFTSMLSACGGGGSSSGPEPDTTPPRISKISISPNAATIPYEDLGKVAIIVEFSEPVDPKTYTAAIKLINNSSSANASLLNASDFTTLDSPPRVVISPQGLVDSQTYKLSVSTDLADLAGNHLKDAQSKLIQTAKTFYISLNVEGLAPGSTLTVTPTASVKNTLGNAIEIKTLKQNGLSTYDATFPLNSAFSFTATTDDPNQFCGMDLYEGVVSNNIKIGVSCSAVIPRYTAAPQWDDYAQTKATTQACKADSTSLSGYHSCVHGGEGRVWTLPGNHACNEIVSIEDDFKLPGGVTGAFNWACESTPSGTRVYSTRLKDSARLIDLIHFPTNTEDFLGWKKASVHVNLSDRNVLVSSAARWWANPVRRISSNLYRYQNPNSTLGVVYVADASTDIEKIHIVNNKDALAVARGVTVCLNCREAGDKDAIKLYYQESSGAHFHWLEGDFRIFPNTGSAVDKNGYLVVDGAAVRITGKYNVLRQVSIDEGNRATHGIRVESELNSDPARNNLFKDVRVQHSGGAGIYLRGDDNTLDGIKLGHNGMRVDTAQIPVDENARAGLYILGLRNRVTHLWSTGNTGNGVIFDCVNSDPSTKDTIAFSNLSSNRHAGLKIVCNDNVAVGLTVANNGKSDTSNGYYDGIEVNGTDNIIRHSTIAANQRFSVNVATGKALSVANTLSSLNKGGDNGIAGLTQTVDASFRGKTSAGIYVYSAVYDGILEGTTTPVSTWWDQLTSLNEGWGIADFAALRDSAILASTPQSANIVACAPLVEACARYDWSLMKTATALFNQHSATPDANGRIVNAIEIINDGIGNDDGLCDANLGETCLETPNVGAYQGHGVTTVTPVVNGNGTTYTLLKYNSQGY